MTESGPWTRQQRWIVAGLSVIVAATRLMPLARSLWDWDEALFCTALHQYDVAAHHPHPPGFPLFILAGKLARLLIQDDFRALRTVSLLAAVFVFPAMVALARALRFPFAVAVSAGVLFAFFPNVWFYGGSAFSDVFNLALLLAGLALLGLAAQETAPEGRGGQPGRRARTRFLLGTFVFSLSLLVRPQNVFSAYPWFAAAWRRAREKRWLDIAAAAALSIAVVAIGYGIAAKVTGFSEYVSAVRGHEHYIATVDGFRNPGRPPSWTLFPLFVIDPYSAGKVSMIVFALALLALVMPKRRDVEALATFLPALVFALFMLNPTGASRLSLGYMPLLALLAADGVARLASGVALLARRPRLAVVVQVLCIAVLVGRYFVWCAPAFRELKAHDSPPVQALKWARANLPRSSTLFVDGGFAPHADVYLKSYDVHFVDGEDELATLPPLRNAWYVADHPTTTTGAINFRRPRKKLWSLFTERYFEASVRPVVGTIRYLDGWYDQESDGAETWRWMGRRARVALQAIPTGGELRFTATVPTDIEKPPVVTVTIDGREVDRFVSPSRDIARRYEVPPSPAAHEVIFEVSHAVNPAHEHLGGDSRDLGMQLRTIAWQP